MRELLKHTKTWTEMYVVTVSTENLWVYLNCKKKAEQIFFLYLGSSMLTNLNKVKKNVFVTSSTNFHFT